MNVALKYKDIKTRPVQIAGSLAGAYLAASAVQTLSPPVRLVAAGMGALLANYIYQSYDIGSLDDAIRGPISGLAKAASDIASGHGSLVDYGFVGAAGYGGYSAGSYALSGTGAAAATKVTAEGSAGLLAELGAGALETVEMLAPLAILL
jgi:hypothetical protein